MCKSRAGEFDRNRVSWHTYYGSLGLRLLFWYFKRTYKDQIYDFLKWRLFISRVLFPCPLSEVSPDLHCACPAAAAATWVLFVTPVTARGISRTFRDSLWSANSWHEVEVWPLIVSSQNLSQISSTTTWRLLVEAALRPTEWWWEVTWDL